MGNGCANCLRVFLAIINFLFFLIGLLIIAGASYLYFDSTMQSIKDLSSLKISVDIVLFVLMGVGLLTIIISAFGCCGAYHESRCMLSVYFVFLLLIIGAEVAAAVFAYLKRNDNTIKKTAADSLRESVKNLNSTTVPSYIKTMQNMLECCVANGTEYDAATMSELCRKKDKNYTEDCIDKIFRIADTQGMWLLIGIGAVAAFELLSMLVAISLCCASGRDEEGYVGVSAD